MSDFEILSEITHIEPIARGFGVRELTRLRRQYGDGHWRKLKGITTIILEDGTIHQAEIHWYEAHGIGKKEFKIKFLLLD